MRAIITMRSWRPVAIMAGGSIRGHDRVIVGRVAEVAQAVDCWRIKGPTLDSTPHPLPPFAFLSSVRGAIIFVNSEPPGRIVPFPLGSI